MRTGLLEESKQYQSRQLHATARCTQVVCCGCWLTSAESTSHHCGMNNRALAKGRRRDNLSLNGLGLDARRASSINPDSYTRLLDAPRWCVVDAGLRVPSLPPITVGWVAPLGCVADSRVVMFLAGPAPGSKEAGWGDEGTTCP